MFWASGRATVRTATVSKRRESSQDTLGAEARECLFIVDATEINSLRQQTRSPVRRFGPIEVFRFSEHDQNRGYGIPTAPQGAQAECGLFAHVPQNPKYRRVPRQA